MCAYWSFSKPLAKKPSYVPSNISFSSPRSSASQWSSTSEFSDLTIFPDNAISLLPTSTWSQKILPLCQAKAQLLPDDRFIQELVETLIRIFPVNLCDLIQPPLIGRTFVSISDEVKIMCKIRQMNLGDGFPGAELGASYTPERVAAVNMISEIIGKYFSSFQTHKCFRLVYRKTTQSFQASGSKVGAR